MQLKIFGQDEWKLSPNDYPQINRIDKKGIQHIELNRGCRRRCKFCHANPDYKTFPVPEITRNIVQITGEGILYDPQIKEKIIECGQKRVNKKVVYYGLWQGIDFRLLTRETAYLFSKNRFGIINNKGKWYKGIRFAWDGGLEFEALAKRTIELLESVGYTREHIQVFVLTNWDISYETCLTKMDKLREWGVKIDDCTWETNKRAMIPKKWTYQHLKDFRRRTRKHNQLIAFHGYDPEAKRFPVHKDASLREIVL